MHPWIFTPLASAIKTTDQGAKYFTRFEQCLQVLYYIQIIPCKVGFYDTPSLVWVLFNCLIVHLERGLLPESQCGFQKECGTINMVFGARQLQEKCQEQNADLYSTYVDLTKAFDTVNRDGLWRIMTKYGCPQKFVAIVWQLHDGMLARVQDNGEISQPFPVSNGVKQGCVLAPTLFSIMFSAMLMNAFRDTDVDISISYCTNSSVFNLRRLQTKTKVISDTVHDFLFANDCASMLLQKLTCNTALTSLPRFATTLASQSVQRRLKLCTSQPQERHTLNPTSQSIASNWMWWTSSPTLAAHSWETSLMMK